MQLCSPLCSGGTNKACYVRLSRGGKWRGGLDHWGDWRGSWFSTIMLGQRVIHSGWGGNERPSSCFPLKGTGGHLQNVRECAIYSEDATIVIWNGSQKRRGSCIFNCSEEQSLITIIEHSESLQTHLALLIWEQESTKHKFLFCSLRQKSRLLFFFSFL